MYSADLEPVVQELQQAFFKLSDFFGSLKSKVTGRAPALAKENSSDVSLLGSAQQSLPVSYLPGSDSLQQEEESFTNWEGFRPEWDESSGLRSGQIEGLDFEQPTASQMPLR